MVGLIAVADGGRLTETAFSIWTLAAQMLAEQGMPVPLVGRVVDDDGTWRAVPDHAGGARHGREHR